MSILPDSEFPSNGSSPVRGEPEGVPNGNQSIKSPPASTATSGESGSLERSPRNRFLYLTACMIGHPVEVHLKNGSVYSGIFHAADVEKDFGIVLKMASMVKDGFLRGPISRVPDEFVRKPPSMTFIIPADELVQVVATDLSISCDSKFNAVPSENSVELLKDPSISKSYNVDQERGDRLTEKSDIDEETKYSSVSRVSGFDDSGFGEEENKLVDAFNGQTFGGSSTSDGQKPACSSVNGDEELQGDSQPSRCHTKVDQSSLISEGAEFGNGAATSDGQKPATSDGQKSASSSVNGCQELQGDSQPSQSNTNVDQSCIISEGVKFGNGEASASGTAVEKERQVSQVSGESKQEISFGQPDSRNSESRSAPPTPSQPALPPSSPTRSMPSAEKPAFNRDAKELNEKSYEPPQRAAAAQLPPQPPTSTRELDEQAQRVAQETEGETTQDLRVEEERGHRLDEKSDIGEETKHSSVRQVAGFDEEDNKLIDAFNDQTSDGQKPACSSVNGDEELQGDSQPSRCHTKVDQSSLISEGAEFGNGAATSDGQKPATSDGQKPASSSVNGCQELQGDSQPSQSNTNVDQSCLISEGVKFGNGEASASGTAAEKERQVSQVSGERKQEISFGQPDSRNSESCSAPPTPSQPALPPSSPNRSMPSAEKPAFNRDAKELNEKSYEPPQRAAAAQLPPQPPTSFYYTPGQGQEMPGMADGDGNWQNQPQYHGQRLQRMYHYPEQYCVPGQLPAGYLVDAPQHPYPQPQQMVHGQPPYQPPPHVQQMPEMDVGYGNWQVQPQYHGQQRMHYYPEQQPVEYPVYAAQYPYPQQQQQQMVHGQPPPPLQQQQQMVRGQPPSPPPQQQMVRGQPPPPPQLQQMVRGQPPRPSYQPSPRPPYHR